MTDTERPTPLNAVELVTLHGIVLAHMRFITRNDDHPQDSSYMAFLRRLAAKLHALAIALNPNY